jgi:misacylated tRNA(Ala) deacylase
VTAKLYLEDPYLREFDAEVMAVADGCCRLSRTAFYPGGGGQPADRGVLAVGAAVAAVTDVRADDAHEIWHRLDGAAEVAPGDRVRGSLDWDYRYALMRHHGLMHVVNTIARDRFGGVITGVQLGPARSRIDFKLAGFAREQIAQLEAAVDEVVARGLAITATSVTEAEYRARPELTRTLNVAPPVIDGRVRVVEIDGFDAQACGATHVHSTSAIGAPRVVKFENKGKDNKRFYWELLPSRSVEGQEGGRSGATGSSGRRSTSLRRRTGRPSSRRSRTSRRRRSG